MIFLCYPKCTTCQKAKRWLDENQITYDLRDIKLENPTYDELSAWYQRTGRSRCKERLRDCLPLRAGGRPGAAAGLVLLLRTGHSRFDIVQESEASPAKL